MYVATHHARLTSIPCKLPSRVAVAPLDKARASPCSCFWLAPMAKVKKAVQVIRLVSQAGTGYFYTKLKNVKANPEKLQLMKHDPLVNRHVLFKEEKLKK